MNGELCRHLPHAGWRREDLGPNLDVFRSRRFFRVAGITQGVSCRLQICDAMRCGVKPSKEFTINAPGTIGPGDVSMPKDDK